MTNHNPVDVCYLGAGRLLNQLNWHLVQAFLLSSNHHFQQAEAALSELPAAIYELSAPNPVQVETEILAVRDELRESFRSESHHDTLRESGDEYQLNDVWPREKYCRDLAAEFVTPRVDRLRAIIFTLAADCPVRQTALRLGECLDQGLRRADIYAFLHSSTVAQAESADESDDEEEEEPVHRHERPASCLANVSRDPGELPPDELWFRKLPVLWRQLGLDTDALPDSIRAPRAIPGDELPDLVQDLHDQIIEHLRLYHLRHALHNGDLKPKWDSVRHQLHVGPILVKDLHKHASSDQAKILAVFEEEGWPQKIDDPIPRSGDTNSLSKTIYDLNRTLKEKSLIHFHLDGTGEGIYWEPDALPASS